MSKKNTSGEAHGSRVYTSSRHPYWDRPITPVNVRFWWHVDKSADDGCWVWTASRDHHGYGSIAFKDESGKIKHHKTHRLSYQMHKGDIPKGLLVLHSCDNRPCVNPAHLRLGTPLENSREMMEKMRHPLARGRVMVCGTQCGAARLTEDQVRAIRVFYATGNISYRGIGDIFGITAQAVFYICERKNWRHVP